MEELLNSITCYENELLKNYCTFRVGGPAKKIYVPKNSEEIKLILEYCRRKNEKYIVLGNGSNVLFDDEGYDGIIIQIFSGMNDIKVQGDCIFAQAGALLSQVANVAKRNSLTGMEFAAGIPGTLGGAVVMNAGAYGGEMKDIVKSAEVLMDDRIVTLTNEQLEFSYRHSIAEEKDMIILSVTISLEKGNQEEIASKMNELREARTSKQPLEYPSAGSTFKRPEGYFAAKLIDDCGLRGYRVGGAMVSEKHCGFVINYNNATSRDIKTLMEDVAKTVKEKYGVDLESEVRIIK